jgi:CRP-like cAMP-binding protein
MEDRERQLNKLLKNFQPGSIIFEEGEYTNDLYILKTGKVAVLKGNAKVTEITEAGTYVGEMSALLGEPRSATLKAEGFCQFYVIPGDRIFKLVLDSPTIGIKLLGILADRLRNTTSTLARREKELAAMQGKIESLLRHYSGVVHLVDKAHRLDNNKLLEMIAQYAGMVYPTAPVSPADFDRALLPDELKRLMKL